MTVHHVDRSMQLWARACELIPGGTQLISRRPTRFACGVSPVYAVRASGARFTDVDGHEYIDWVSGIGAIILGYADPVVDDAVREQIATGTIYSINHELEIELAEALVHAIPCAEMVRYTKGGGEACAVAVRIARGVTGRDKVLFCGYHGWHDWYLAANLTPGSQPPRRSVGEATHLSSLLARRQEEGSEQTPQGPPRRSVGETGTARSVGHRLHGEGSEQTPQGPPRRSVGEAGTARSVGHRLHGEGSEQTPQGLDAHLFPGIEPIGVPACLEGTAIPFPYGDAAALGEALDRHRGEIAAIIMEPLRSELPPEGYLAAVRQLATEHQAVLIFDEVSTGLRFSPGGVQPVVGVVPDLAVFAKSLSNGYPLGAVVGRRDVMEPAGNMFISSTYWSDTIGLRAALTTLREVARRDVPGTLQQFGSQLQQRLRDVAAASGAPVRCRGVAVHPQLSFDVDDPVLQRKLTTLYIQEMAKRGCHGYASFYLNAAQGDAELEQTVDAAAEVFRLLAVGLERGSIDSLLECTLQQESFRRIVK